MRLLKKDYLLMIDRIYNKYNKSYRLDDYELSELYSKIKDIKDIFEIKDYLIKYIRNKKI